MSLKTWTVSVMITEAGEVYSIKFVRDLRQVYDFLRKLTATI